MKKTGKIRLRILAPLVVLGLIGAFLWQSGFFPRSTPPAKVDICSVPARYSGLLYIAQAQGYFQVQGLEVTLTPSTSSAESEQDLKAGRCDLACLGAFNLTREVMAGPSKLRVLATLANGQVFTLIARPDKGISKPEELRGQAIGLVKDTPAEFFLARFLLFHHVPFQEVTVVDVKSADLPDALAEGKVAALLVPEPLNFKVLAKMGTGVVTWPAQEGQDIYWLLITREDYLQSRPRVPEKLLRALKQAARYIQENPEKAQAIICQQSGFPLKEWDSQPLRYDVNLDLGLLLVLEDEAAWMIKNRLTDLDKIPNFLEYLAPGPLSIVAPQAVRLVLPAKEPVR